MGMETTLPGDLSALDTEGIGEGEPIWDRMSKLIRSRRLDVRQLMAGFDRSKKGFFDLATLRRALSIAPRAASRVTASPSSLASGARQTRHYAADPNAPPKVPYPWNDPMNPSNWKEEHVRDRSRRVETRDPRARRDETRRDSRARSREARARNLTSSRPHR